MTGHECWVGDTGQVILTTADPLRGVIYLAALGDKTACCVWRGLVFGHISASSDGRYFAVDDVSSGLIYVGSLTTGRLLPLCISGVSCGAPQYTHPRPYMTPGNRRIIYNSDHTGLGQVWAVAVRAGFLEALDEPTCGAAVQRGRAFGGGE